MPGHQAPALIIRLFGPSVILLDGTPLPRLRSRKGQWLLALLTFRHGSEVERSWLAGVLWPDSPEPQAFASLRNSLIDLRRALGPEAARLRAPTPRSLCLDLTGVKVDVLGFDAALAGGDTSSLEEAVALYRGPLLEGCTEAWAFQEREVREQGYLGALEQLAAAALERGAFGAAEQHLRRAVALDGTRETAQRGLMQALAGSGNYAAALQAFRELRLLLHRELNAEPDAQTRALYEQIRSDARRRSEAPRSAATDTSRASPGSPRPLLRAGEETFTFLFTDIEGSTQRWERDRQAMQAALDRHDHLVRTAIETYGGHVFKTVGDAFCAAFGGAPDALAAALQAQRALQEEEWGEVGPLRVRMALYTGTAEPHGEDYRGPSLNRVARLLKCGHGGQILLSFTTQELVRDYLPEVTSLRDFGEHRLKDLIRPEHIYQLVAPDLPADFPLLQTLGRHPHNLPAQPTALIGREQELAAALELLRRERVRLLTLTGAGGTGKTRLGLQVAADLIDDFAQGVFFIDLAPISDPGLVASSIAQTLGVREEGGRPLLGSLKEHLREQQILLVLDNFEQILEAAPLVAELLTAGPRLKVMVTSRAVLHLRGEHEFPVPPLALPDPERVALAGEDAVTALSQYGAIELFLERAQAVRPDLTATSEDISAVVEICMRVDGLPLAIELAAARIRLFSAQALLARLASPLKLLTGGARDLPARQQTLQATISWSYDLLEEWEQALFRRLAVFVGGFTLEAAEEVCDADGELDLLGGMASLLDKSLMRAAEGEESEPRFGMFETIRAFGVECLEASGEAALVRGRHLDFFLRLVEEAEPHFLGPGQRVWHTRLEADGANLRAALEWSQAAGPADEKCLRMALGMLPLWNSSGQRAEGCAWVERCLAAVKNALLPLRAKALTAAGTMAFNLCDFDRAIRFHEDALALFRALNDAEGIARALNSLGCQMWGKGDYAQAKLLLEESVLRFRESGFRGPTGHALQHLGLVAEAVGSLAEAQSLSEEYLELARRNGDEGEVAITLNNLGVVAFKQVRYARARALFEQSLAIYERRGDRPTFVLHGLGLVALREGDTARAASLFQEGLDLRGNNWWAKKTITADCLEGMAGVAGARGQSERAARLFGAAEAFRETFGGPLSPSDRVEYDRNVAVARAAMSEAKDSALDGAEAPFAAAWREGRALSVEQAVAYALEEVITA